MLVNYPPDTSPMSNLCRLRRRLSPMLHPLSAPAFVLFLTVPLSHMLKLGFRPLPLARIRFLPTLTCLQLF